ncbi:hypothetical protein NHX12_026102 [Muraenolepis orangiensis]|uniref:Uncharacterized protein n=1 Tax=Muraenolepis orangiensis TaxID=630683 RepID=A0A9Q0IRK8_9TELE|nr:hypothetical protein NHX12_026102 [Muraenolepis orangiensis]
MAARGKVSDARAGVRQRKWLIKSAAARWSHPRGAIHAGAIHAGAIHAGAIHAGAIHAGAIHAGAIHAGAIHAGAIHAGASEIHLIALECEKTDFFSPLWLLPVVL